MMVNPISSVRFCAGEATDIQSILNRPGAYSRPTEETVTPASQEPAKKSGKTGKIIAGLIATAAIIIAGLGALKHFNVVEKLGANELANANFIKKIPHYLAVAGEQINKYGSEALKTIKGWIPGLNK